MDPHMFDNVGKALLVAAIALGTACALLGYLFAKLF